MTAPTGPVNDAESNTNGPVGLLTRADQLAVALLVGSTLVALPVYWWAHGGGRGGLIEIDRAGPQEFRFQVDVNAADWPELSQLPGVGETLARRIVASRAAEGPFQRLEDLRRVQGIGAATLEALRPHVAPLPGDAVVAGPSASR